MKSSPNTTPQKLTAQALIEGGDRLQYSRNFCDAIDAYTEAIIMEPGNAIAYHQRGWAKLHNGDRAGSVADWSKAIALNPDFADAYADRAAAKSANDLSGALSDYKTALQLDPQKKKLLQPIITNIDKRLHHQSSIINQQSRAALYLEKKTDSSERAVALGTGRREFLKNVSLMGMATMAVGMAGCGPGSLAGGKKGVKWGMVIDLNRCVGCRACTIACKAENHTPPGVAYNVVMEHESGIYPHNKKTFLPRPCMQCEKSSCSLVCPVKATYHREDGIVVVDYDKCIGCRYCIAACPYGARSFDFGHNYSADMTNPWENEPSPEYGQHRIRAKGESPYGNVRKCTFCMHRIYNEIAPACSTTCLGNAIHFGNLADPDAKCMAHGENLQELLATRNYMRLKEEVGNEPRVFYLT